jgi:hypothetical protein
MLLRLALLTSAAVRGRHEKRSTAAVPVHSGSDEDLPVKLSPTVEQLYSENVRFPFWPA